jgi:hypothetical protein
VAHGLALLQADRRAAAERLLASHPHMSDRAVGHSAGSAAKTVAVIRKRSSGEVPQSNARVGRDGRVRPLNGGERRQRAADLLAERLEASLRDVARLRGQRRPGTQPLSCRSCCTAPRFAAVSRERGCCDSCTSTRSVRSSYRISLRPHRCIALHSSCNAPASTQRRRRTSPRNWTGERGSSTRQRPCTDRGQRRRRRRTSPGC